MKKPMSDDNWIQDLADFKNYELKHTGTEIMNELNQSNVIGALAAALSKVQGAMVGAVKDSSNPFFKSKYADLSSVWDACRVQLAANNLCVIQTTAEAAQGRTAPKKVSTDLLEQINACKTVDSLTSLYKAISTDDRVASVSSFTARRAELEST